MSLNCQGIINGDGQKNVKLLQRKRRDGLDEAIIDTVTGLVIRMIDR